ncbi:cartilage matrix protein-like [Pecten maximus]|uniref:cartilage matrix protein-like n=1 Tax=Pecten maximus TaxID=6579 RepID=UPI001458B63E|nr:cartilage matrix protein-like [Pecten maximus]
MRLVQLKGKVDGGWSKWGFWSPCTKTCAGGTHYQERTCSDPPPANGGKQCTGPQRQTGTCNTHACPTTPPPTTTTTALTTPTPTTPSPGCGVVPADIVFILDSSGSVGSANYQKMLQFVQNMVQGFTIGPNETEIAVVTFSNKPKLEFHLNKYHDKQSIVNAISNIGYVAGGTNTADALKYARETSFTTANGKRPNAAQIAIVITDGMSNSAGATATEAAQLRGDGITVFSVGVGSGPKTTELNAMATDPDNQHVFVVNNFDALTQIKGTLAQKACEVCGAQADIVFLLDSSGSVGRANFNKMLKFVTSVSNSFKIGPHDVQIGVDTFQTSHKTEFTLNAHLQKADLVTAVNSIAYHSGSTHTGEAIQYLHNTSFTTAAGHRPNVPKIAIVVTDGNSNNRQLTAAAS